MAVFGFSQPDYDIVAFTEKRPGTIEDVLPVVVILLGTQPQVARRPDRETRRRNAADMRGTSGWSNGFDEVRYNHTKGVVSVTQREYERCADGRTLVVLADARRPADAAECVAISDLPIPRIETIGTVTILWRMLKARVLGRGPYQWPQEQWLQHLTRVPAVQAFLSDGERRRS